MIPSAVITSRTGNGCGNEPYDLPICIQKYCLNKNRQDYVGGSAVVLGENYALFETWYKTNYKQGMIILRNIKIYENTSANRELEAMKKCVFRYITLMVTSSNGNIFSIIVHLCGEFTSYWWISHTKGSDAETPSRSLWRQCNVSNRKWLKIKFIVSIRKAKLDIAEMFFRCFVFHMYSYIHIYISRLVYCNVLLH